MLGYKGQHALHILEHLGIPEPQHAIAGLFEKRGPPFIGLGRVLSAVDLDNELLLETEEIDDVRTDRLLPLEFVAMELPVGEGGIRPLLALWLLCYFSASVAL